MPRQSAALGVRKARQQGAGEEGDFGELARHGHEDTPR